MWLHEILTEDLNHSPSDPDASLPPPRMHRHTPLREDENASYLEYF